MFYVCVLFYVFYFNLKNKFKWCALEFNNICYLSTVKNLLIKKSNILLIKCNFFYVNEPFDGALILKALFKSICHSLAKLSRQMKLITIIKQNVQWQINLKSSRRCRRRNNASDQRESNHLIKLRCVRQYGLKY